MAKDSTQTPTKKLSGKQNLLGFFKVLVDIEREQQKRNKSVLKVELTIAESEKGFNQKEKQLYV